jgi:Protein of unknown function (DUF2911)
LKNEVISYSEYCLSLRVVKSLFIKFYKNQNKKQMKKIVVAIALFLSAEATMAQTIKTPAPSTKQDFGLSTVEITYSRPNAKGRKIFGDLVPYGAMWRTGANGATKVTFADDVKVGGKDVKAGSYALYTVPNKDSWEVIINKGANNGGLAGYTEAEDVARFMVKPQTLPFNIETFTIMIDDVQATTMNISVMWENQYIEIPVEAAIDDKVMAQIDKVMNSDTKPYFQAASYYFENGKDIKKALEWATKAADAQPTAYWVAHLKAKIQAKAGDKAGAIETAKKSMELAKTAGNMDYVKLNENLIKSL